MTKPKEEEKVLTKEELMVEIMKRLNNHQDFCDWRDQVAKPLLLQWEQKLANSETLSEVELRATIKHYNTIKTLFIDWFAI